MRNPLRFLFRGPEKQTERRSGMKARLAPDGRPITEFPPVVQSLLHLYGARGSLAAMYRMQPEVRTVISYLANQVAGIKLKLYEKVPEAPDLPDGRLELSDHDMMLLLRNPGNNRTSYDLWYATVSDIGIYDVAYWGKVRKPGGAVGGLVRIPPSGLFPVRDPVTHAIRNYRSANSNITLEAEDLVIFGGYDPELNSDQVSPLETLRRILAEEWAAGRHRERLWQNAARKEGIIERPLEAPEWSDDQREAFLSDWEAAMTGEANSGRVGLLEEGMTWRDVQFDSRQLEYIASRKLTRVEVAAEYGIPASLVGAADRAVTAEERTGFYQDKLVPFLHRLEQTVDMQLLPEFEAFDKFKRQYTEFNIDEKMKGSFEVEAAVMSTAVGGPWMTVNEARARRNLPPKDGGDELFVPLNSVRGGGPQASPQSPIATPAEGLEPAGTTPGGGTASAPERMYKAAHARLIEASRPEYVAELTRIFARTFARQKAAAVQAGSLAVALWDAARWNRELSADMLTFSLDIVDFYGHDAAKRIRGLWSLARTREFLKKDAESSARRINASTKESLLRAKEPADAFEDADVRAASLAETRVTYLTNWAIQEAAEQSGREV